MAGSYAPKIVMITGATSGFGTAFAQRFAALGSKLVLHGRSKEKLSALAAQFDVPVYQMLFDLRDRDATTREIENIPAEFKDIDLLINNAGGALGLDKAQEANIEDWEGMIEMNNTSLVRITRLILPGMVAKKRGHVINIGSVAGNYVYPGGNVYNAVKAFVKQFSLAIRADLAGTNVRVTNIEPGLAKTGFSLQRFKGDKEKADSIYAGTEPLTAEDIADAVVWVACQPEHVNVNRMEIMPTGQAFGPLTVERS